MLAAKKLPIILQNQLVEGLEGISLLTIEGSILSSAFLPTTSLDEITLTAISASVWNQYSQGNRFLFFLLIFIIALIC